MVKKIGIDARLISQTGIGTYTRNLLYFLDQLSQNDIVFYIYLLESEKETFKFKGKNFIIRTTRSKWHSINEQYAYLQEINQDHLDLVHFTYFAYPFFYKKPFIATIHDLTPLLLKTGRASTKNPLIYQLKFQAFKYILSKQLNESKAIITPSQSVKKQILDYYGENYKNKIYPIYEGVDMAIQDLNENSSLMKQFNTKFMIYVGNFYPHKNVDRLIKAYSKIKTDVKLILLGPVDYFSDSINQLINQMDLNKKVVLFSTNKKEDLVFFYKNAISLVHPSLSEGFGLPIVDAMYFKLPIIASKIPVFQEIIGENYTSFDPTAENDITGKIQKYLDNKNYSKIDYSLRLQKLSFKKMAEETFLIYKKNLGY